jgi:hypothetical protein
MTKQILTAVLFITAANGQTQENSFKRSNGEAQRYWFLGTGLSFQSMYDEAVSYVRYHNSGAAFTLGLVKSSEKKYREFYIDPSFVVLKTDESNDLRPMKVSTTRFSIGYQYLVKCIQWSENSKLYAGGSANLLFNLKTAPQLDNSQLVYDYALSIGPAAKWDKQFTWKKRKHTLSFNLVIPILSHIARPYYLNRIEFIDPDNDFLGDLFSNSHITSVNDYIRVISDISVIRPIFNGNALKLAYQWDFYKMKTINKVYAAEHQVTFVFMSNY